MSDLAERFAELFDGNHMAIGTEEGGCARLSIPDAWTSFVRGHLTGDGEPIGVYPMARRIITTGDGVGERWCVRWGCIDFDEGEEDSWVHAKNVHLALQTFGISAWIERSRSKGYHVWVFLRDWTEAHIVRRALLAACQIVDAPTREINPKQIELQEGQLGNYVRLPYPGHLTSDFTRAMDLSRRVVVAPVEDRVAYGLDRFVTYGLDWFVQRAWEERSGLDELEKLATYYKPPRPPIARRDWSNVERPGTAVSRLRGKARIIYEDGPLEGSDRSDTLWKLACYLHEDGRHTPDEALELLRDADSRWGKYADRPDGEQRLTELRDKAWSRS